MTQGNGGTAVPGNARLRHAMEIRHPSFLCDTFINLLRRHKVALVVADSAGKWPLCRRGHADFVYLRLHGDVELVQQRLFGQGAAPLTPAHPSLAAGSQPEDAQRWCSVPGAPPMTCTATSTMTRKCMPLRCPPPAGQV